MYDNHDDDVYCAKFTDLFPEIYRNKESRTANGIIHFDGLLKDILSQTADNDFEKLPLGYRSYVSYEGNTAFTSSNALHGDQNYPSHTILGASYTNGFFITPTQHILDSAHKDDGMDGGYIGAPMFYGFAEKGIFAGGTDDVYYDVKNRAIVIDNYINRKSEFTYKNNGWKYDLKIDPRLVPFIRVEQTRDARWNPVTSYGNVERIYFKNGTYSTHYTREEIRNQPKDTAADLIKETRKLYRDPQDGEFVADLNNVAPNVEKTRPWIIRTVLPLGEDSQGRLYTLTSILKSIFENTADSAKQPALQFQTYIDNGYGEMIGGTTSSNLSSFAELANSVSDNTEDQGLFVIDFVDENQQAQGAFTLEGKTGTTQEFTASFPDGWTVAGDTSNLPNGWTINNQGQLTGTATLQSFDSAQATWLLVKHGKYTVAHNAATQGNLVAKGGIIPGTTAKKFAQDINYNDLNQKLTRTITVNDPHEGVKTISQSAQIYRDATVDMVDGSVVYGDWSTAQWPAYSAPAVDGYTPSQKTIEAKTVTNGDQNDNVTIDYTADKQTAAAKLDELLSDGYQLANQAAAAPVSSKLLQRFGLMLFASLRVKTSSMGQKAFGSAAYDTDDTNVQVFTVHVTHQKETRQEAKTITRTINYHQPDGTVITVTQPATITRTVLFDKVTKQATPTTAWTMTAHAEQATPKINGYTPDKTKVDVASVDGTSQNSSVDVVYYRDKQKAIIDFVDDDRGQTLSTVTVDGKLNDSIDFSLANQALESYRNHGYQLAFSGNDDLNDAQTVFKAAKYHAVNGVQNYVVHLTHVWQDATEDKTIIRTINYHLPDGTLKTITQPATINRSVKIDKAVGTKICGKWSQASWPAIEVPSLAGYSPSQAAIVAETVDGATADKTVDVFYQGHEQAASVRIIDLTTGKPLTEEKLHGLSGEPLDFAKINAELTAYLSAGYTLASNNQAIDDLAMKSADFDSDDQSDQVFVVYLTHRINEVPETQTVTRVIKYRQPDGSVKTVQETQLSKRLLRIDAVTGQKVASGDWTPISWPEIVPPTFKGYTATVSQNIPQNDGTVLVEVSYQAELNDDHNLEQDDHNQDADKHNSQTIHQLDQSDSHSVDSAAVSPSIPRTDKPAGMANKPTGKQTDHSNNQRLVQTGNQGTGKQTVLGGLLLGLAGMLSGLGLKRKKRGDK